MAAVSLLILLFWPKVSRKVPAPIVTILVTTAAVALLGIPVETIGSRFGDFRVAFPAPRLPPISLTRLRELASPSFTIALLAAIESLLSAVVADGMIGSRHKSNVELVGQGIANIASGLFGGMKRMADVTNVGGITRELSDAPDGTMTDDAEGVFRREIPPGVEVYEVNGPFFFGAADKIKDVLSFVAKKPRVFILRMRNVPAIDASGIRVLDDLFASFSHMAWRS